MHDWWTSCERNAVKSENPKPTQEYSMTIKDESFQLSYGFHVTKMWTHLHMHICGQQGTQVKSVAVATTAVQFLTSSAMDEACPLTHYRAEPELVP